MAKTTTHRRKDHTMTKATTTSGHASTADGTHGPADPGDAVDADRDPDPHGPEAFEFIVTTIEDFAAFVALARDHAHGQQAFPGFVAAKTRDDSPGDSVFLLSAHSLEAFAALVGIVRG